MANIFSFSNSIVVVTGAASGIGRLMALGAATRGATAVVLWDVNEKALASVSAEIEARGSGRPTPLWSIFLTGPA